jgi:hypothetical protein
MTVRYSSGGYRQGGRHLDYCGLCGESYDEENLVTCGRDFCYRCGDSGAGLCNRCREAAAAPDSRTSEQLSGRVSPTSGVRMPRRGEEP